MERRGYVRREPNPADRRSIMVRAVESAERELAPAYAGMMQGTRDLLARYSDAELAVILDFLTRATAMTNE